MHCRFNIGNIVCQKSASRLSSSKKKKKHQPFNSILKSTRNVLKLLIINFFKLTQISKMKTSSVGKRRPFNLKKIKSVDIPRNSKKNFESTHRQRCVSERKAGDAKGRQERELVDML